jgi:outer membrane protein OmpA-like peptidoglycan-associated protein
MNATTNSNLTKCSTCGQMTAPIYIAERSLFSRKCRMCKNREEGEREAKRKAGTGPRGILGWILPALILGGASMWYFQVEIPGGDEVKAYFAQLFKSDSGEGSGRAAPEKAPRPQPANAALTISNSGPQNLTLNLRGDVLFDSGDSSLKAAANGSLKEVAKLIRQRPQASVVIRGYTDSIGSDQANLALSRQRAESVRDWLAKSGIPAKQLSVLGMGAKDPVAPNTHPNGSDNPAGREQNRRVTLSVTGS